MSPQEKPQFLLLFRNRDDQPDPTPDEMQQIFGKWMAWLKGMKAKGQYVGGDRLLDSGKVLREPKGSAVTDGPFAESKETIGGYVIVTADTVAQAAEIAKGCPGLDYGTAVEVRPIEKLPPSEERPRAAPAPVADAVDHLFRRESGRLVAILTRRFGAENLHLAEDVVQDALIMAMKTWPFTGVPANPSAWILQTARNRALDQTRRARVWSEKQAQLLPLVEDCLDSARQEKALRFEDEIQDSQLRMMFVCCHPGLPLESQVALILKVLCGFGEREIAAAFFSSEAAVAKRLNRARQHLREQRASTELPPAGELTPRVGAVQQALYLLFNEGYKASHGAAFARGELCEDAIRLGELMASHPFSRSGEIHALLALMHFTLARLPARVGAEGAILTLARQDRGLWDQAKIRRGLAHLEASASGSAVSRYHLQAAIAACHSLARSDADTDWARILGLYDELLARDPSPVVALNRAVALAIVRGPLAGLGAMEEMEGRDALEDYHLYHAVAGHLWMDAGDGGRAAASFRRARDLATVDAERQLLSRRLEMAEAAVAGVPG